MRERVQEEMIKKMTKDKKESVSSKQQVQMRVDPKVLIQLEEMKRKSVARQEKERREEAQQLSQQQKQKSVCRQQVERRGKQFNGVGEGERAALGQLHKDIDKQNEKLWEYVQVDNEESREGDGLAYVLASYYRYLKNVYTSYKNKTSLKNHQEYTFDYHQIIGGKINYLEIYSLLKDYSYKTLISLEQI